MAVEPSSQEDPRPSLEQVRVRFLAEYLAARVGLGAGQRRLELVFMDGTLVRVYAHAGPIGVDDLERRGVR
jgi:hypothetical protein